MENPFEPINEKVYRQLHHAILFLEYAPGEKLVEAQLAEEMQVSRSPVKAALQRLEAENLVERLPGKSPRVAPIRYQDCVELVEARKGIEGYAAFYAAERITPEELARLKQTLEGFRIGGEVPTPEQYALTDARFHQIVVQACRNRHLIESYSRIQSSLLRYRLYIMRQLDLAGLREYEHHLPVYNALKNRSATLARDEMLVSIDHMYLALRVL